MTEPRCKLHPREALTLVERAVLVHGKEVERENLYICLKCPEYLTESDVLTGDVQGELGL